MPPKKTLLDANRRKKVADKLKKEASKKLQAHYVNRPRHICAIQNTAVDTKVMWRVVGLQAEQLNRRDTSLLHAVRRGDLNELKALLRLGPIGLVPADHTTNAKNMMSAQDWDGFCAVHWAAMNGWIPILEVLLKAKCPLDSVLDTQGRTPLHMAAKNGHDAAVRMLVNAGSHPTLKDIAQMDAVQYARMLPPHQFTHLEKGITEDRIKPDPAFSNMYENRRKLRGQDSVVLDIEDSVLVMPGGRSTWWLGHVTHIHEQEPPETKPGAGEEKKEEQPAAARTYDVRYIYSATVFFLEDDAPAIVEEIARKEEEERRYREEHGLGDDDIEAY
jgi:hypothetical protein